MGRILGGPSPWLTEPAFVNDHHGPIPHNAPIAVDPCRTGPDCDGRCPPTWLIRWDGTTLHLHPHATVTILDHLAEILVRSPWRGIRMQGPHPIHSILWDHAEASQPGVEAPPRPPQPGDSPTHHNHHAAPQNRNERP